MHWYAVNTKSHHEDLAELNLQRLGIETFHPKLKQSKVIRRKSQMVSSSLFPGYLFARFDLDAHYRAVTYARGVRKIVAFGSSPAKVDEEIITVTRARLQNGYLAITSSSFTPGQSIRIQAGPLRGLEAIFEREMSDHLRVVLLLRTLAYQPRAVVPLEQVVYA